MLGIGLLFWLYFHFEWQQRRTLQSVNGLVIAYSLEHQDNNPLKPRTSVAQGLIRGQEAPELILPDLMGKMFDLRELHGKKVLLIFFNPDCGFCNQMAVRLASPNWMTSNGDLVPVIVSTGNLEYNKTWFQRHSISVQVVVQKVFEVGKLYKAIGTPTGYLVDEHGKIASPLAVGAEEVFSLARLNSIPNESNTKKIIVPHHETMQNIARPLSESKLLRNGLPPGSEAPDFCLPLVEGGQWCLNQYRGQQVLLVFSDPQCGPCNQLLPQLEEFHRRAPSAQILIISRGNEAENKRKVSENGLTIPVVLQRQWEISRLYGMFATPIGYMVNEQGIITFGVAIGIDAVLALCHHFDKGK